MTPESVGRGKCHDGCVDLFVLLDLEQGAAGRPFRGVRAVADELGWGYHRVYKHLRHLESQGFVSVERENRRKIRLRVLNPARGVVAVAATTDEDETTEVVAGAATHVLLQQQRVVAAAATGSSSILSGRSASDSDALVASNDASSEGLGQRAARATVDSPTIGAILRRNGARP